MHSRTRGLRSGGLREGSHAQHQRNGGAGGGCRAGGPPRTLLREGYGGEPTTLPLESLGRGVVPQRARNSLWAFVGFCQRGESILEGTSA